MSRSNYFVVILNLSNYYDDHRLTTRIFVGVEIKTVKDLQQKISRLYHIENFHLLCARNQFLHPSEDIRIIGEGEILWAIPINSDDCTKSGIQRISPGDPSKYQLSGIGPQLEELRKASSSKASSLKDSSLVSDGSEFVTCKKERTWTANHPTPPPPPHFDEQDDDSFCEEVIKRAPSMNTMKPRVGDIIAFKGA